MAVKSLGRLTIDLVAKAENFIQGMSAAEKAAETAAKRIAAAEKKKNDLIAKSKLVADKDQKAELARLKVLQREQEKAMAEIEKQAQDRAKRVRDTYNNLGRALIAGITTAVGLVTASIVDTMNKSRDIVNFSNLSNSTTEEFQLLAFAAQNFGISQEKLADQMKDFGERVGEFLDTGAGPMKDFFEYIAPQVGVTSEQFRNLSGPQALQLYISSLQQAGLNQQQMSFFLESMASDLTNLIPLYADGGSELERYGDIARKTGAIMDNDLIATTEEMRKKTIELQGTFSSMRNEMASQLLPNVMELTNKLMDSTNGSNDFKDALDTLEAFMNIVVGGLMILRGVVNTVANTFLTAASAVSALKGVFVDLANSASSVGSSNYGSNLLTALGFRKDEVVSQAGEIKNSFSGIIDGAKRMGQEVGAPAARMRTELQNAREEAERLHAAANKSYAPQTFGGVSFSANPLLGQQAQGNVSTIQDRVIPKFDAEARKEAERIQKQMLDGAKREEEQLRKNVALHGDKTKLAELEYELREGAYKNLERENPELVKSLRANAQKQDQLDAAEEARKKAERGAKKGSDEAARDAKRLQENYQKILEQHNERIELLGKEGEVAKLTYATQKGDLRELSELQKQTLIESAQKLEAAELKQTFDDLVKSQEERIFMIGKEGEIASLTYRMQIGDLKNLSEEQKSSLLATENRITALEKEEELRKKKEEEIKQDIENAKEFTKNLEHETELLGKSVELQERMNLLRDLGTQANTAYGESALKALETFQAQREAIEDQVKLADAVRDSARGFFTDLVEGTKSFGDALKDALNNINKQIQKMIIDKWVEQLFGKQGTPMGGSVGGSSAGGWFSNFMGMMFGGGKASGGPVGPNRIHPVNEMGMEMLTISGKDYLLTGNNSGNITSAHMLNKNSSNTQVNNFVLTGRIDKRTQEQISAEVGRKSAAAQRRNY